MDTKYDSNGLFYSVELNPDGNYYLSLSSELLKRVFNNSSITLYVLSNDMENDGEDIKELTTKPLVDSLGNSYEVEISEMTLIMKSRDQSRSTVYLDFETNITKEDYEVNVNSLDSVILAKAYDNSDVISNSIKELNPNSPDTFDVKLGYYDVIPMYGKFEITRIGTGDNSKLKIILSKIMKNCIWSLFYIEESTGIQKFVVENKNESDEESGFDIIEYEDSTDVFDNDLVFSIQGSTESGNTVSDILYLSFNNSDRNSGTLVHSKYEINSVWSLSEIASGITSKLDINLGMNITGEISLLSDNGSEIFKKYIEDDSSIEYTDLSEIFNKKSLQNYTVKIKNSDDIVELAFNSDTSDWDNGTLVISNPLSTAVVPHYMYLVVASQDYSVQMKRDIMNSIKRGLMTKELLLDYGTLHRDKYSISVGNYGYKVDKNYRPYQLPYIINSSNKDSLSPIRYDESDKKSRVEMPDLVVQIENAKYVPVDISLYVDFNYETIDELMNLYLSLIGDIKKLFELSKSNTNLKFNNSLSKSDIRKLVYRYKQVNSVVVEDFKYYRDNLKHGPVSSIQFSPFELPVLGKLNISIDYHLVTEITPEVIRSLDNLVLNKATYEAYDTVRTIEDNARIKFYLEEDPIIVNDHDIDFKPTIVSKQRLGITYWIISASASKLESMNKNSYGRTIIAPVNLNADITTDDANVITDNTDTFTSMYTDSIKFDPIYLNY